MVIFFHMAGDLNARRLTINYDGGSLEMAVGNIKSLFADNLISDFTKGVEETVTVKGHERVRVIGGPKTTVASNTYTYTQFPSSGNSQAAGGEEVLFSWEGSEGWWTGRVNGPLWKLAEYLNSTVPFPAFFKAKGGRTYGPFSKTN